MTRSAYDIVREALAHKRTVIAMYDGFRRELCPWAIGSRHGVQRGLFYQRGGLTSSGPVVPGAPNNWRCMDLERLEILEVVDGEWIGPTEHRRTSGCMDVVDLDWTPRR
jgi:hypothetical protein